MAKLITIAGPQSSGKSVAVNHLKMKHPDWYFLETIDPYTIGGMNHPGAAYTDQDLQMNIMRIELIKINSMKKRNNPVFIAELGIFRLVYARYFCSKKVADEYYEKYVEAYDCFDSSIVFIDTAPEISFERRKDKYVERIRNRGITDKKNFDLALKKYKDTIFNLYPHWHKFFDKVPYPKIIIKNSEITAPVLLSKIERSISTLVSGK